MTITEGDGDQERCDSRIRWPLKTPPGLEEKAESPPEPGGQPGVKSAPALESVRGGTQYRRSGPLSSTIESGSEPGSDDFLSLKRVPNVGDTKVNSDTAVESK